MHSFRDSEILCDLNLCICCLGTYERCSHKCFQRQKYTLRIEKIFARAKINVLHCVSAIIKNWLYRLEQNLTREMERGEPFLFPVINPVNQSAN
jgi:hypothetical protein